MCSLDATWGWIQSTRFPSGKWARWPKRGRDDFLRENQEAIIGKRIADYFGDILLLNAPKETIEYLVSSEISYYNLSKIPLLTDFLWLDPTIKSSMFDWNIWLWISSVNLLQKKGATVLRVNDPMEKSLHSVVTKKFILSLGRLFGLLRMIRNNEPLYDFLVELSVTISINIQTFVIYSSRIGSSYFWENYRQWCVLRKTPPGKHLSLWYKTPVNG